MYNIHFSLIPVSTYIQLLLRPVSDCLTWAVSFKAVMPSVYNIICMYSYYMVAMHAHIYTSYLMSIMSCSCLHCWTHADIYVCRRPKVKQSCQTYQLPSQPHSSSNAAAPCLCSRASSAVLKPQTHKQWCFLLSSPTQHSLE